MGEIAFQEYISRNKTEFDHSIQTFEVAKARRRAKREEKRRKLRAGRRRLIDEDTSESEENALAASQWRVSKQRTPSPIRDPADGEAENADQLDSLVLDRQSLTSPGLSSPRGRIDGDLFIKEARVVRKPPLQQSESSSSSSLSDEDIQDPSEISHNYILGGLLNNSNELNQKTTSGELLCDRRKSPQKAESFSEDSRSIIPDVSKPKHTMDEGDSRAHSEQEPPRLVSTSAAATTQAQQEKSSAEKVIDVVEENQRQTTHVKHTPSSNQHKSSIITGIAGSEATLSNPPSILIKPATPAILQGAVTTSPHANIERLVTGNKESKRIRMVNEPKSRLKKLQVGDTRPKTLLAQQVANVRSGREGSSTSKQSADLTNPKSRPLIDNPYGRREIGTRRLHEDRESREIAPPGSVNVSLPLEIWETDKVPLVCPHWRLSNNCPYGTQKCHFMHRNQDANGRDYPLGDMHGWIPPKYRKPPLMCIYWLTRRNGCRKPDAECNYAHTNTGWIPNPHTHDEPFKINSEQIPEAANPLTRSSHPVDSKKHQRSTRRSDLTCWFWAQNQCRKAPEDCAFQHRDTGVLAEYPYRIGTTADQTEKDPSMFLVPDHECSLLILHLGSIVAQPSTRSTHNTSKQVVIIHPDGPIDTEMNDVYQQQPLISNHGQLPRVKMTCLQLNSKIEQAYRLDFTDMFTSDCNNKGKSLMERRAFLLYHLQEHSKELEVVTRWLLMHHVEVSNAWYDGSWDKFRQHILNGGSGVIIVGHTSSAHRDLANSTRHIPTSSTSQNFQGLGRSSDIKCVSGVSGCTMKSKTTLVSQASHPNYDTSALRSFHSVGLFMLLTMSSTNNLSWH